MKAGLWLLIILFILILGATIALPYEWQYIEGKIIKQTVYQPSPYVNCKINATRPSIIIRLDDVQVAYLNEIKFMADNAIKRNVSLVLGAIPRGAYGEKFLAYMISIKKSPMIEIAQHGTYHNSTDLNESVILAGKEIIEKRLHVDPVTYVVPLNVNISLDIFNESFIVVSSGGPELEQESIIEIEQDAQMYDYSLKKRNTINDVLSACNKSVNETGLCVVTLHPQEFVTDAEKQQYIELLEQLKNTNASFTTFKDIVYCGGGIEK